MNFTQPPAPTDLFRAHRRPEAGLFRLRPPRPDDLDAMAAVFADPRFTSPIPGQPLGREDCWRRLLSFIGHWSACGFGVFAIAHAESDRYVGEAGFFRMQRGLGPDFDDSDEMGWSVAVDFHGAGLAAAACETALRWARAHRPGRIVCMIAADNSASRALAARLGFTPYRELAYRGEPGHAFERVHA